MDPELTPRRRGRPPSAERQIRRTQALQAAIAEIVERGYEAVTMLDVAQRAQSSKESLYAWFGNKQGLVVAAIRAQAASTNAAVEEGLRRDAEPRDVLIAMASGLLSLLVGPGSVALNRAAMTSPELAAELLKHGRYTTGPLVEAYLHRLHHQGTVELSDAGEGFRLLYGLVVQDSQIRALLGEAPPSEAERNRQATLAVDRFLELTGKGNLERSRTFAAG